MGVDYIVLIYVDQGIIPDSGGRLFVKNVQLIKLAGLEILVECLVSDFHGEFSAVAALAGSGQDVYGITLKLFGDRNPLCVTDVIPMT